MAAAAFATQSNNQLYSLTPYGRGYLIKCSQPSACDFYAQKYLTVAKDPSIDVKAFWNATQNGWIVRGRDLVYAQEFVRYLNATNVDTEEKEAAEALASMKDEAEVDLGNEPLYTLIKHGRAYLIECNDPKQSTWWGEKYIALSNHKDAAVAFWNASLEGYIVKGRDVEEAEFFLHIANRPSTAPAPATPKPKTQSRRKVVVPTTPRRSARLATKRRQEPVAPTPAVRQLRRIAHPEVPSRTFQTGPTVNFIKKFPKVEVRRRLFTEDEEELEEDEEYEPESADDEEDDDEAFDEVVYQPYKGMTLRHRPGNCVVPLYWLTCGADHKLYGRPYLGYPAAKAVRANCWKVEPNMEKQYIDGGAKFVE